MVPLTGLHTRPKMPFPKPLAPPLIPPDLAPLTGSDITPATAEKTLVSMDLEPWAKPDTTLEGALVCFSCF